MRVFKIILRGNYKTKRLLKICKKMWKQDFLAYVFTPRSCWYLLLSNLQMFVECLLNVVDNGIFYWIYMYDECYEKVTKYYSIFIYSNISHDELTGVRNSKTKRQDNIRNAFWKHNFTFYLLYFRFYRHKKPLFIGKLYSNTNR